MLLVFFDHLFRFGAIAVMAGTVVFLSFYSAKGIHRLIAIITSVASLCYLITSAYDEYALFGAVLGSVIEFMARTAIVMVWLFCLSLSVENFRMKPLHFLVLGLYVGRSILFQMGAIPGDLYKGISLALSFTIYGYLLYIIFAEYAADLPEKRRNFRLWFIAALVTLPVVMTFDRLIIGDAFYSDRISLVDSIPIFFASSAFLVGLVQIETGNFLSPSDENDQSRFADIKTSNICLLPDDKFSLMLLEEKMQAGLYRETGLTVAGLAKIISIPKHRLRWLINQHLGHRNISQYLNNFRIAAAKKRLADAKQRHVSVLEIAMDVGYVSLRPFNRAFKNRTDQTPSEYRKNCLLASTLAPDGSTSVVNQKRASSF